jgi:multidrug efflux pump subunit AcrA (membrane-fusion protein)
MNAFAKLTVVALLSIAIGAGIWRSRRAEVVVVAVARGGAVDAVYATGTVEAADRASIKTKVTGSVVELLVREGDVVKKGDLLARIDNPAVTFALQRGRVQLHAASKQAGEKSPTVVAQVQRASAIRSEIAQAKIDIDRSKRLSESGSVAGSETEKLQSHLAALEAQLSASEAEQAALRIDLDSTAGQAEENVKALAAQVADTEVRAPLDGVVLRRMVEPGEVVGVNQTLFDVGDVAHLILKIAIDEADVARVSLDPPSSALVTLYAFKDRVFHGQITRIFPDADRASKSFLAWVTLTDAPPTLRSGMSAEVNLIVARKEGVLIAPMESLVGGRFVWVDEGGLARRREVVVGIHDLLRTEIVSGVHEGDLVIVEGQTNLVEGARLSSRTTSLDAPLAAASSASTGTSAK